MVDTQLLFIDIYTLTHIFLLKANLFFSPHCLEVVYFFVWADVRECMLNQLNCIEFAIIHSDSNIFLHIRDRMAPIVSIAVMAL